MIRYIISTLLIFSVTYNLHANKTLTDAHVNGHTVNKKTGEHIPFLTIRLKGTSIGTNTDATGHYDLKNLPIGSYEIEASGIGYIPQTAKITTIKNKTLEIKFELSEDIMQLEQVVVTGNKSEVKRRNSSTLVNVLGNHIFDMVGASCLAEGLNFQPGVRVENDCQNCGFTQVRINGLDGHYSQILMNSRPVFSALTGVYGLEQIPANMIDRVEIMRGGGSALFGSSAIGGTINVITKDPVINSAEVAHTLTSIGISGALDNNTTLNASLVMDNRKGGIFLYGQNRIKESYDHDGDGFSEIPAIKSQTIGMRSFFRPTDYSKLTLQLHNIHEFRRGGDHLEKVPHDVEICEQTDHNIQGGDLSFDISSRDYKNRFNLFASFQNTKRESYYGGGYDPNAYGNTHDLVVVTGGQYTRSWDKLWFMPAELIGGVEYNYNYLKDVTLGYDHDVTQKVNIFSAYLQNEWRTDKWGFLIGGRLDKHSLINNPIFSPRANIRFNPSKNVNFRASYSTGFRAPQAFDEDFHVAVVGGERVVTILAKDLKQESSNSVSLSVDLYHTFGTVQANLLIEGFYTNLKDVFTLRKLDEPDDKGNQILERYNGSGATVMGLNLESRVIFSSKIQAQAGFTLQKSRYKELEYWSEDENVPGEKRMFRTPDYYGYLTLKYNPIKQLTVSATGTYSGEMLVQHFAGSGTPIDVAVKTPTFFDMNLKVSYDFKILDYAKLQINGGVLNIFNSYQKDFDKGADRDSGYIYGPAMPRSLFVGAKLTI